jgi:citrate lyase subunit beta/citryl-CoA lyase
MNASLTASHIMRSKLFVPGSRPELFDKAFVSSCDAVSFDLEDAVALERKAKARSTVGSYLSARKPGGKVVVVRVNAVSSGLFAQDVEAIANASVDIIKLPKVESTNDVIQAAEAISRPIGLLATIETPKGLRLVHEIACAHPSVVGLQIGYADLFSLCGMDRQDATAIQAVRLSVRFAAAEAGVDAYDGAFLNVQDADAFRAEAEAARRLGFSGKSCIHPSQIPIANEVFSPRAKELAGAERILAASREAAQQGVGAFLVDGKMVDRPVVARAQAIVDLAARLGINHATS